MSTIAIAVVAYNRPHYLKWTLHSLENQTDLTDCDFHLFIDGERTKSDKQLINESIRLWNISSLPNKHLHRRHENVSIAKQMYELKNKLSKEYEYFVVIEDDVQFSKHTVYLLKKTRKYLNQSDYFSSSISFLRKVPKDEIEVNLDKLIEITRQHWWLEMYKSENWLHVKPVFKEYYDLVRNINYRNRDHAKIRAFFAQHGFEEQRTSQDAGMDFTLDQFNWKRITTAVNRGLYLGVNGTHFNQALAEPYNFLHQVPYQFESDSNIKELVIKV